MAVPAAVRQADSAKKGTAKVSEAAIPRTAVPTSTASSTLPMDDSQPQNVTASKLTAEEQLSGEKPDMLVRRMGVEFA